MRRLLPLLAAFLLIASRSQGEGVIELRPLAEAPTGTGVRLGQIALLSGPDAEALQDLTILEPARWADGHSSATIDLAQIRQAVAKAPHTNMGRLTFVGNSCRLKAAVVTLTPNAPAPAPTVTPPPPGPTVRTLVTDRLAEAIGVATDKLRLTFDSKDEGVLRTSTKGLTAVIQPTGSGDITPVRVRLYDGDRITADAALRVRVLVQRSVQLAKSSIAKGDEIRAEALSTEDRWLPPSIEPADSARIVGTIAKSRVSVGDILRADDVQAPIIARKGDLLTVDVMAGAVRIQRFMRTLDAGRDGDIVRVQVAGTKNSMQARLSGPGRAVAILSPAPTAPAATNPPSDRADLPVDAFGDSQ